MDKNGLRNKRFIFKILGVCRSREEKTQNLNIDIYYPCSLAIHIYPCTQNSREIKFHRKKREKKKKK